MKSKPSEKLIARAVDAGLYVTDEMEEWEIVSGIEQAKEEALYRDHETQVKFAIMGNNNIMKIDAIIQQIVQLRIKAGIEPWE